MEYKVSELVKYTSYYEQYYEVEANSEQEALEKYKQHKNDYIRAKILDHVNEQIVDGPFINIK